MFKFLINLFTVVILGIIAFGLLRVLVTDEKVFVENSDPDGEAQKMAAIIFNVRQKAMIETRELHDDEKSYLTRLFYALQKWGYEYDEEEGFGQAIQTFPT